MSKKKSNKKKDKVECRNCAVEMANLETYIDQLLKKHYLVRIT